MTLRDLNDEQTNHFRRCCDKNITERNKGRRVDSPLNKLDYKIGYSDGVRDTIAHLDYLPDKTDK